MKIAITGGSGLIGSEISNLFKKEHEITILDFTEPRNSDVNFIKTDIENVKEIIDSTKGTEVIIHLAAALGVVETEKNPVKTLDINAIGTKNVLEACRINNIKKIIFSSSSEIYGEPEISPQNENYRGNVNTIGIRSCYDEGKRVAETLMMDYHKQYNIDIRIVRIFNTYGPNMDKLDGRVVTNFIRQILNNEDITVYGDGSQTRSFCYIDDMLEGLIKLMNSDYNYPVNLGNPDEINMKELIINILKLIKSKSQIIYLPLPLDDPTNRKPDITLAKKILNWEPKIDLKTGLIKTIEYIKNISEENNNLTI